MMMKHPWHRHLLSLFVIALALLGRPASPIPPLADGQAVVLAYSPAGPTVEIQATPDSEPAPPEPFPQRRRREQLAQLGVDRWHAAGFRGQGITIAVLDTGLRGYRQHLGHALPAHVRTRSFRVDGNLEARNSQHGILCAEVLHALAPDAQILLANWDTDRPQSFLDAASWARSQGARIISCSVIMPSWSDGQGGGRIDTELCDILGSGQRRDDMLFFASAGNTAQRHWSGTFHDNGDGWHEWQPGVTGNALSPWGPEAVSVELYGRPGSDYEIEVLDTTTGYQAAHGRSRRREPGRCCGVARFRPQLSDSYEVRVRLVDGPGGPFHLVALGGGLEGHTAPGSVACPADCPQVLAVGAIHRDGHRASYSSCGSLASVVKPELVATIPFASLWRPAPFSGTSAAAPQAAGLAALCWSRHPDWTAAEVRHALRHAARSLSARAPNPETGYGLIHLPAETVANSGGRKLQTESLPVLPASLPLRPLPR